MADSHPALLAFEQLQHATGYTRAGDVHRCLDEAGIRYFCGRAGIVWTTTNLVNDAGGLSGQSDVGHPYDPRTLF